MRSTKPQLGRLFLVLAAFWIVMYSPHSQLAIAQDSQNTKQNDAKQAAKAKNECKGAFSLPLTVASANRLAAAGYQWSYLENFDGNTLKAPGLSGNGKSSLSFGKDLIDSVSGNSWWGSGSLTFSFQSKALGALPTRVGIVWTDGAGSVTFEAWAPCGYLGKIGPLAGIPDGNFHGGKEEDKYFEVHHEDGITKIRISNTEGGIEVDNLRYARGKPDTSCKAQEGNVAALSKELDDLIDKTRSAWVSKGKGFPPNAKRRHKARAAHASDAETKGVKLVAEILLNGGLEDRYLKGFNWKKYKNDVSFAAGYIKTCKADFAGLYGALKKEAAVAQQNEQDIKKLISDITKIFDRDMKEFVGKNDDKFGWKELKDRLLPKGNIGRFY